VNYNIIGIKIIIFLHGDIIHFCWFYFLFYYFQHIFIVPFEFSTFIFLFFPKDAFLNFSKVSRVLKYELKRNDVFSRAFNSYINCSIAVFSVEEKLFLIHSIISQQTISPTYLFREYLAPSHIHGFQLISYVLVYIQ